MKTFSGYGGFHFNASVFFNVVLPPIIFHQGYSLKKRKFFKFFGLIISFGVLGTLVQFLVITTIAYSVTNQDWFPLPPSGLNLQESMIMGALFSSADEVATLSVIKQDKYPKLSALLFGEGVLNDAVSILLFRTIMGNKSANPIDNGANYETLTAIEILLHLLLLLGQSVYLLFLSGIIGVATGLCVAICFKYMPSFKRHPEKQTVILMLGGYFSFSMSEALELSGILSAFFCGIALSHYAWHNLSDAAQITSKLTSESIALIAEAYCFAAIGLSVPEFGMTQWSFSFIGLMLLSLMAARAASTYGIIMIGELFNLSAFTIPFAEQHVIYFGGLVRASISWAQVVQIAAKRNGLFVTSTLGVILFTVGVFSTVIRLLTAKLEPEIETLNGSSTPGYKKVFLFDEDFETIPRSRSITEDGTHVFRVPKVGPYSESPSPPSTPDRRLCLDSRRLSQPQTRISPKESETTSSEIRRTRRNFTMRSLWNRFDNRFFKPIFGGTPHPVDLIENDSNSQPLGNNSMQWQSLHGLEPNQELLFPQSSPLKQHSSCNYGTIG